jgi:hypothetical protein
MKKTATVTALVIVMALSTQAQAGGPPPVCMVVDKVVLEPDEKAPTRIQIWGTFIFCKNNASYDRPVSGYLYYKAGSGKEEVCRKQWAKLQKLAADKHIVAFGFCGHPKVDGHLRKAGQEPSSPVVFPVDDNEGFTNGDAYARDFPTAKKLLAKASLGTQKK